MNKKSLSYWTIFLLLPSLLLLPDVALAMSNRDTKPKYVFVVDVSGSMKKILPHLKIAVINFIAELPESTPVHLASFHEEGQVILSVSLNDATRPILRRELNNLSPSGQWTHFTAAVEAIQDINIDLSQVYTVLLFTDQLSDPKPGFKDIGIDEIASRLPNNLHLYIISSPEALASLGDVDSSGFVSTQTGLIGVAADLKSSKSILDRLKTIAAQTKIVEIIRPKPKLSTRKLLLLCLGGVMLLVAPILFQVFQRRALLRQGIAGGGWTITLENGSEHPREFIIYPNQVLGVGSAGTIKVDSLPPVAAQVSLDRKLLRLKPYADVAVNGSKVTMKTKLTHGDRVIIENRVHLVVKHMETCDGTS